MFLLTVPKVSRIKSADTLYQYNLIGEQTVTCLDVNGNGTVDYAGLDRINRIDRIFELRSNDWWQVTYNEMWVEINSAVGITSSVTRVRMTGLGVDTYNGGILTAQSENEDWLGNVTKTSTYTDAANVTTWNVTDTPNSNVNVIQKNIAGYPVQSISSTAITNNWMYDGFSRQITATDGRTSTTVTAYNDLGQVAYNQSSTNRTSYFYNSLGQRTIVSNALGQVGNTAYDLQGNTIAMWGTSYPVAYQFDTAGRMIALATTRTNDNRNVNLNTLIPQGGTLSSLSLQPSSLDITRWFYDGATGLLTNKVYADGNGTAYTYTDSGKLAIRKWARGVTTTYTYNALGQLTNVAYTDNTPHVTFTYDRLGRMTSAISASSTRIFEYTGLALTKEVQDNYIIERVYDNLGRAIGYELYSPDDLINPVQTILYGYSDSGRFNSVTFVNSGVTNQCSYTFLSGTDLISGYSLSQGGAAASLTVNRIYEPYRNLITAISNAWNDAVISSSDYSNNALGQRTKRADYFNASTINNHFDYNIFGELIKAAMGNDIYINDYDPIGNRIQCTIDDGQLTATNVYSANQLNQYTAIAHSTSNIQYPTFDEDGNMTWNGRKVLSYDAENCLSSAAPNNLAVTNGAIRTEYSYDYMNRRVEKTIKQLSGRSASFPYDPSEPGTWDAIEARRYIWDGWNIIAELVSTNTSSFIPHTSSFYTWGLDLSGTLQGAGGIGGLLADTKVNTNGVKTYYSVGDANGNITEYVDDTGTVKAHYEYSFDGGTTAQSGTMVDAFSFRFSTKYYDPETGFYYYGHRYYDPILGRWISTDPIEESGGPGRYLFLENDAINYFDLLGREKKNPTPPSPKTRQWKDKQLSATESHVWNCMEWESGYGTYDEYIKHFINITFNPSFMNNPPPHVPVNNRPQVAGSLVSAFGMTSDIKACWDIELKNIRLSYTNIEVISDKSCESGKRNVRRFKVKAHVESMCKHPYPCTKKGHPVRSMQGKNVETIEYVYWLKCVSE